MPRRRDMISTPDLDMFPNELDKFKKDMQEKKWDFGKDDEELFEYAMHGRITRLPQRCCKAAFLRG